MRTLRLHRLRQRITRIRRAHLDPLELGGQAQQFSEYRQSDIFGFVP